MLSMHSREIVANATGIQLGNLNVMSATMLEQTIVALDDALEASDDANLREELASAIDMAIRIYELRAIRIYELRFG